MSDATPEIVPGEHPISDPVIEAVNSSWLRKLLSPALWLVVVFTIVGAMLRYHDLRERQFWGDEVHTYQVANEPATLRELFAIWWEGRLMIDPPTYYILSFFNTHGASSHDELRLRLFSLLFGVLAIPYTYIVVRRLSTRWDAACASGLMALCTFAIQYSQEYRPYSMLLFVTLLFGDALVRVLQQWSFRRGVYLYAASALLIYTHLFGGFVLAAAYPFLVWTAWRTRRATENRVPLLPILLLPVVLTVLYAPMFAWGVRVVRYNSARFGEGSNAQINKALHRSFTSRAGYFTDLLYSFAAWRLGEISRQAYMFIGGLLLAGLIRLLAFRPRVFAVLMTWVVVSLVMTFGFYEYMQYPYEPRRNIIHLPAFLFLLAAGIGLPAAMAFRLAPRSWFMRIIGVVLSLGLFALMAFTWWQSYWKYDSHGYRNEVNQADWRGMAKFVSTHALPEHVVAIPIAPETWQRLHYMFYHEKYSNAPVSFPSTLDELTSASDSGRKPVWYIITQPWTYPADLFEYLVTNGQWFNFYGGSVILVPPRLPQPDNVSATVFAVASQRRIAIGGDRKTLTGNLSVTGTMEMQKLKLDEETSAVVLDLSPGMYQATLARDEKSSTGSIRIFPVLPVGEWIRTMDFTRIEPVSSLVMFPMTDGQPHLFMQHNGVVWFHYFLETPGLYRFTLEAKHDRPGPFGLRLFFSGAPELQKMWFDRKDNSYGTLSREVRLESGRNELRLYYDSFNRVENAETFLDHTNEFESTRWKLERIGD